MLGSSGWHLVVDNPGFNQFHLCRLSRFFRWHHFLHLGYPIYTHHMISWVLLIVEISTAKPKSCIILPNSREKELLNDYFHSRTLFKNSRNASERLWTLFEHFFPLQNVRSVPNDKNHSGVLFPHQPPKSIFFGFGVKKSSIGKLQVSLMTWEDPGAISEDFKVNSLDKHDTFRSTSDVDWRCTTLESYEISNKHHYEISKTYYRQIHIHVFILTLYHTCQ